MKNAKKLTLVTAIASALPGVYAPAAFGAVGIEEVVVTARKRDEVIQDVPVAITAVSSETLERANIFNFEEATRLTPGFQAPPSSTGPLAPAFSMRGSVNTDAAIFLDPSVGVYVDDVYIARAYGIGTDLLDLENVQVLKGPQGTLFGRNSTAGAMLLTSRSPELGTTTAKVSVGAGSDTKTYSGIFNLPIYDTMALRIALQENERDPYVRNKANAAIKSTGAANTLRKSVDTEIGDRETSTYRIKFRFMPIEPLDIVASWDKFESDVHAATDQLWLSGARSADFDVDDDEVSMNFDPYNAADTETVTLNTTYSADSWELKFIASYREWRHLRELDYDGGDFAMAPTVRDERRHGSFGREAGDQQSYELQFNTSLFDERVELVAGALYFEEFGQLYDYSYGLDVGVTPPGTSPFYPFGAGAYVEQDVKSQGYYTQATWHITDETNLTLGARYTYDQKDGEVWGTSSSTGTRRLPSWDFNAHKRSLFLFTLPGAPLVSNTANGILRPEPSFYSSSWLASLDHKLTDDILVYGKVSTGFRAGGFNGRGVSNPSVPFVFEPEEVTEYEVGFKADLLDGQLRWNTAFYSNETTDKQFTTIFSVGGISGTSILNAGTAESRGLETEFTYLINDNFSLSGSYAYIDAEVTEFESGGVRVPDSELPVNQFIPENQWSLALNYDQEFETFKVAATASYTWIDEMLGNNESAESIYQETQGLARVAARLTREQAESFVDAATTDAYGLLNLSATVSPLDDRYSLTLWVKNALDERKVQSTIGFVSGDAYQYVRGTVTEPRTWGVTGTINF
jgi:iron complex outermembrane receptor protein